MRTLEEISRLVDCAVEELSFKTEPCRLYEPISYMMSIGGKKIRPNLVLATYNLFRDEFSPEVISTAIALEIFHEFTLIHDDIMDRADTRRSKPTVYKKWDENVAILSGDAMMILAWQYLSKAPAECRDRVTELFTATTLEVCEGQQYDMDYETLPLISMDDYMKMIGLKTAVLLACSTKIGAMLAGVPSKICDALYQFGYHLGLAFQITDDFLDTFGDEKVFGKRIGGDIANNKKSWLLVECYRRAGVARKSEVDAIMAMGDECRDEKVSAMQNLYKDLGVDEAAKEAILQCHSHAMAAMDGAGLTKEQYLQMAEFAEKLIHRDK